MKQVCRWRWRWKPKLPMSTNTVGGSSQIIRLLATRPPARDKEEDQDLKQSDHQRKREGRRRMEKVKCTDLFAHHTGGRNGSVTRTGIFRFSSTVLAATRRRLLSNSVGLRGLRSWRGALDSRLEHSPSMTRVLEHSPSMTRVLGYRVGNLRAFGGKAD